MTKLMKIGVYVFFKTNFFFSNFIDLKENFINESRKIDF